MGFTQTWDLSEKWYSRNDGMMHGISEIPKTLQPFCHTQMDGYNVDVKSFFRKLRNVILKQLPEGFLLYQWNYNWYTATGVIQDSDGLFYYISFSDVRHWQDAWINDILIRTMSGPKDWTGGMNHTTDILNIKNDLLKLKERR